MNLIIKKMLINRQMKINCLWLLILPGFLWLLAPLQAEGLTMPRIYVTAVNLSLEEIPPLAPGDEILGEVTLWNHEDLIFPDLKLRVKLIGSAGLIDAREVTSPFSLLPQQETNKNFRYTIPIQAPSEEAMIRIELINSRGEDFAWIDQKITVTGLDRFVEISDFSFVRSEEIFHPGGGLVYQPLEPPKITFRIENQSNQEITVYPVTRLHRRSFGNVVDEKRHPLMTIRPHEPEQYLLDLDGLSQPNSYLTELVIYDSQTNLAISNIALYRWIIPGRSANIISLAVDQPYYWRQREALVDLKITGPADHLTPSPNGTIKLSFYDYQDKLVGQAQQDNVSLIGAQDITLSVPIEEIVTNPSIVATIQSGGTILDEYRVNIYDERYQTPAIANNWWQNYQEEILFIVAILVTFLMLGLYFGSQRQPDDEGENLKETLVIFIVASLMILAPLKLSQAITIVNPGCCETQARLLSPRPPSEEKPTYFLEEEIRFVGSFSGARADNQLFFNKISFYITEDKEITFTDCCRNQENDCLVMNECLCATGCQYAYGAKSSYYPLTAIRNAQWCDQVKSQPDTEQNNIYKLGEIYPDDQPSSHQPYRIEYDQTFTIPQHLPFSGPVRFYVVYSGTHWNDHWHWSVIYQEGHIATKPKIKSTWVEWNYTDAPRQPILAWEYQSENGHRQSAYQIILSANSNLSNPLIETGWIKSSNQSYGTPAGLLEWNQRYYWQVRVEDEHNQRSAWSPLASLITPLHAYPTVDFDWQPQPIHAQSEIQFVNKSNVYGGSRIARNQWVIRDRVTDEVIFTSNATNPRIIFDEQGYFTATLSVTDSSGYSASLSQNIEVRYPLSNTQDYLPTPVY